MTDIRSLEQTLLENLPWNKARIKFIARFLLALYAVRTVNLSTLAAAFSGPAQILRAVLGAESQIAAQTAAQAVSIQNEAAVARPGQFRL